MKVGIITVYEPTTNLGSFLQTYALQEVLKSYGNDVYIVQSHSTRESIAKVVFRINPKREFFLRLKRATYAIQDIKRVKLIKRNNIKRLDGLVYGSDEIWNLDNSYFHDGFFWGENETLPKIAYAVSVGAVDEQRICADNSFKNSINDFNRILVRDTRTHDIVQKITNVSNDMVCDPTMLIPVDRMSESIKPLKYKYLLVYTYGIDAPLINQIKRFATEHDLKIVSVFFWHIWADQVIECSALQFSTYIKNAEYVFTTTFHGAVFTMLNHKKCCIYPYREKVRSIVLQMQEGEHLIDKDCSYDEFEQTMQLEYDSAAFEERLEKYRFFSHNKLKEAIGCLEK